MAAMALAVELRAFSSVTVVIPRCPGPLPDPTQVPRLHQIAQVLQCPAVAGSRSRLQSVTAAREDRPMYKILRVGLFRPKHRLLAADGIRAVEEYDQVARDLHTFVRRAHKVGFVSARQAVASEMVVTHWNGA